MFKVLNDHGYKFYVFTNTYNGSSIYDCFLQENPYLDLSHRPLLTTVIQDKYIDILQNYTEYKVNPYDGDIILRLTNYNATSDTIEFICVMNRMYCQIPWDLFATIVNIVSNVPEQNRDSGYELQALFTKQTFKQGAAILLDTKRKVCVCVPRTKPGNIIVYTDNVFGYIPDRELECCQSIQPLEQW